MKAHLLSTLTVLLAAASFSAASAQVGIYGKFDAAHLSSSSTESFDSTGWFKGATVGGYYDFLHFGPVSLGGDVRGSLLFQNPQKYRDVLFGLRLAAKPPVLPIKPYVQGSVGVGGFSYSGLGGVGTHYNNKFQFQILGGVDYTLFPYIDWRVAEIGYGRMSGVSSFTPAPGVNLFTIGTGIVVRLP
jgi:hypothetical protein